MFECPARQYAYVLCTIHKVWMFITFFSITWCKHYLTVRYMLYMMFVNTHLALLASQ